MVAGALLLLAPALWNGFPFMYNDSRAYVMGMFDPSINHARSVFYSLFLRAASLGNGLWPIVAAQALISVYVMRLAARHVAPGLSDGAFFGMLVLLCVGTALPWTAGQVMPDFLAGLVVLAVYLLGFHGGDLAWPQRTALLFVLLLGLLSHHSLLLLVAWLAVILVLARLAWRRLSTFAPIAVPRFRAIVVSVLAAIALIVASNYQRTGDWFYSKAGPGMLLARLVENGLAARLLDQACPSAGYRLCAYRDRLPATADRFLWDRDSPFLVLGGFAGMADEAAAIVRASLMRDPLLHLRKALRATFDQARAFATGEGIFMFATDPSRFGFATAERAADQIVLIRPVLETHLPTLVEPYLAARQQRELIPLTWLNDLHGPVVVAALLALLMASAFAFRRRPATLALPVFILLGLIGNAAVCGALSGPHHRYQARLIWLLPFVAVLTYAGQRPERTPAAGLRGPS